VHLYSACARAAIVSYELEPVCMDSRVVLACARAVCIAFQRILSIVSHCSVQAVVVLSRCSRLQRCGWWTKVRASRANNRPSKTNLVGKRQITLYPRRVDAGVNVGKVRDGCEDCSSIPQAIIAPCSKSLVCGTDRNTYANSCLATCQGISISHSGSCEGLEGTQTAHVDRTSLDNTGPV
jgi:hypothetical protein